jgi:hypothetical protein
LADTGPRPNEPDVVLPTRPCLTLAIIKTEFDKGFFFSNR